MGGQQHQQERASRTSSGSPGRPDPHPHAPGKQTRVYVMGIKPTSATMRLEQALARADGYLDRMFELGPADPSYKTFAVSVDAVLKSVDQQIAALETQGLSGDDRDAVLSARQQWSTLASAAVPAIQDALGVGTGLALVDRGPRCDPTDGSEAPTEGCYLVPKQRERLIASLDRVVTSAMQNFHAGLARVRVDELLKSRGGWDFLCEVIFGVGTGALMWGALKGLSAIKALAAAKGSDTDILDTLAGIENPKTFVDRIAVMSDRVVITVLSTIFKGARNTVRSAYEQSNADSGDARMRFLARVEAQIKPMSDDLFIQAPSRLDDVGLVALVHSYKDPVAHDPDAYESYVRGLLAQFDASQISKVGSEFEGGGRFELRDTDGVYQVIKRHGTGVIGQRTNSIGGRADQYHVIFDDGRVEVVSTVPHDLEAIAVEMAEEARIHEAVAEAQAQAKRSRELHLLDDYTRSAGSEQNERMDRRGR